jgi:hypothetical protein
MLIRLLLLVVFFLWALLLPLPHRLFLREQMPNSSRVTQLAKEEFLCLRAITVTDKLSINDHERLTALFDLARLRYQQLRFADAERIYKQIIEARTRLAKRRYDEKYIQAMLNLAAILRAENSLNQAQSCYESVLLYDQTFLSANDSKVARDLNNLGINWYLKASSQVDHPKQRIFMTKANTLLEDASKIYALNLSSEQGLANTLATQYIVLKDLGELKKAKQVQKRALIIERKFKRLCLAP